MSGKKEILKTFVIFGLIILFSGAFTLMNGFSDKATAPHVYIEDSAAPLAGAPDISATANASAFSGKPVAHIEPTDEPAPEPEPKPEPEEPENVEPEFHTIYMEPQDVFRGDLILINYEYRYEIPDDHNLIPVSDFISPAYRSPYDYSMLSATIIEPLNSMMDAYYSETGRDTVAIISGFRSYEAQQQILNSRIASFGRTEALRWVSLPGHSEHHTGLAFDFGFYSGGELRTFLGTGHYAWFRQNSHDYGFILRYPNEKADITKTAYEPWHFRYVGIPHAFLIHENDLCLEEYIELIMMHDDENPYVAIVDEDLYDIYFTSGTEIRIPIDCDYYISGNNIDGFIVTLKYNGQVPHPKTY